jgi:hypothetical protein
MFSFCGNTFGPVKSCVKIHSEILDIFLVDLLHVVYMDEGHVYLRVVSMTWMGLDPLAFILQF